VHSHEAEEVCEPGLSLYARALRESRVPEADAEDLPCVVDSGLLRPSLEDPGWLRPLTPAVALPRLLRGIEDEIAGRRRHEARLAEAFEPLLTLETRREPVTAVPEVSLLNGLNRINDAISLALMRAATEVLTVQPGGMRPGQALALAFPRDQETLSRGCRMRTLYQHTTRHDPKVLGHYERLQGDVEVRTLDETPERMVVVDREVAFIPANGDRTVAVEVRHPPLVTYLATTFDRLWRLATPMYPRAVRHPSLNGVTPRQQAIAALLVEGHTDAVVAQRLGMNVRTARVHIAKLAATLGSESRAQLGYLIGRSGILDQEQHPEPAPGPREQAR
jgi:DNA-binding CsgD family transcriptional regulator/sugar-specific transcriptional regulator TrmB